RRDWLRLVLVLALLCLGGYGNLAAKTAYAQCTVTCSADCSGGCDVSFADCGLTEWIPIAAHCCRANRAALNCSSQ
ncbi:MAG: hypothetical protein ACREAC_03955, partial [Blastocatellia bacterium]